MKNKITKLYKYRNFNEYTNNIIINSSLYFSPVNAFNDPFDCNLSFRKNYSSAEIKNYFKKAKGKYQSQTEEINEAERKYSSPKRFCKWMKLSLDKNVAKYGIVSLSTTKKSILMWSHYAYNHTGLVFEFDKTVDTEYFKYTIPVNYKQKKYNFLSYTSFKDGDETEYKDIHSLLLTKYKDWKYEKEQRLLDLNFHGEKQFKKEALKTIIFGAKSTKENIVKIIKLCECYGFHHVQFKKAKLVQGKFKLVFNDIDISKYRSENK